MRHRQACRSTLLAGHNTAARWETCQAVVCLLLALCLPVACTCSLQLLPPGLAGTVLTWSLMAAVGQPLLLVACAASATCPHGRAAASVTATAAACQGQVRRRLHAHTARVCARGLGCRSSHGGIGVGPAAWMRDSASRMQVIVFKVMPRSFKPKQEDCVAATARRQQAVP